MNNNAAEVLSGAKLQFLLTYKLVKTPWSLCFVLFSFCTKGSSISLPGTGMHQNDHFFCRASVIISLNTQFSYLCSSKIQVLSSFYSM